MKRLAFSGPLKHCETTHFFFIKKKEPAYLEACCQAVDLRTQRQQGLGGARPFLHHTSQTGVASGRVCVQ